ncbi:MAG: NUDIX domain-containing protein [Nanoarchaeota archaeon]
MGPEVLVVKREHIFPHDAFQGFLPLHYKNYFDIILDKFEYKERNDSLENDPTFLQIVPYIWLINSKEKKVFIYKRAPSKSSYKEERHLNKLSGGVGGHIDKEDLQNENLILDAAVREMKEELVMASVPEPKFIGYINDDSTRFSEVHLGIVGIAETTEEAKPADGMAHGQFYTAQEVEELFANPENKVESWTQMSWPVIKRYLV